MYVEILALEEVTRAKNSMIYQMVLHYLQPG